MTRNEKSYFKKYAGIHRDTSANNYVDLFDIIESQKEFDPDKTEKKFRGNYLMAKHHLQQQLSRSLQSFHGYSTKTDELYGIIRFAQILYKKRLFDICEKELRRGSKIARKYGYFHQLIDIIQIRIQVMYARYDTGNSDQLFKEKKEALNNIERLDRLEYILSKIIHIQNKDRFLQSPESKRTIKKLMEDPILKKNSKTKRLFAEEELILRIYSSYYRIIRNKKKSYDYRQRLFELFQSNPALIKENPSAYISSVSNYIIGCAELERFEEAKELNEKLLEFLGSPAIRSYPLIRWRLFVNSSLNRIQFAWYKGDIDELHKHSHQAEQDMKKYRNQQYEFAEISLLLTIANGYLVNNDLRSALRMTNIVFQKTGGVARYAMNTYSAYVMSILIHYQNNNPFTLQSQVRALENFLSKWGKNYHLGLIFARHLEKALEEPDKQTRTRVLNQLRNELVKYDKEGKERFLLNYMELYGWLDAQISGTTVRNVLAKKN